jgi:acetyl esterase
VDKTERSKATRRAIAIAGLCLLAVAANVIGPGIFWHATTLDWRQHCAFIAIGALVSEFFLLAIWCALSQQAIKVRLPLTFALVLVVVCSYCLGLRLPDWGSGIREMWLEAALLLTVVGFGLFILMQVPLWLIRSATRTRIATPETIRLEGALRGRQFSLGYLMLWTGVVGVLLAIVRNTLPTKNIGAPLAQLTDVAVFLMIYIVLALLLGLPCIWIALTKRPQMFPVLTLAGTITFGPFIAFACTEAAYPGQSVADFVPGVLCYEVGLTGTTLAVLLVMRFLGYRMLAYDAAVQSQDKGKPLDPQVRSYLDAVAAQNRPAWETLPPAESRALFSSFTTAFGEGPQLHRVENRVIAEHVPVRIYTPSDTIGLPVVVYYHGGGWVLGNLDTHDALCRRLASETECVVVAVDYRLAPDAKFPAAFDDCLAATSHVSQHADEFNIDPTRLVVAGDSAGGNLAAAVAIRAAELGSPAVLSQVLIYPVVEPNFETESYVAHAEGFGLSRKTMMWFWEQYLAGKEDATNPYAVPGLATNLQALPPAHFIIAEHDVLLSEGKSYAKRLQDAGVPTTMRLYTGMIHGFVQLSGLFDVGRQAISDLAANLRIQFNDRVE